PAAATARGCRPAPPGPPPNRPPGKQGHAPTPPGPRRPTVPPRPPPKRAPAGPRQLRTGRTVPDSTGAAPPGGGAAPETAREGGVGQRTPRMARPTGFATSSMTTPIAMVTAPSTPK